MSKTKTRVLVIDDDAAIRDTIKLLLETEGYEVDTAADGAIGLDFIHRDKLRDVMKLVVLDLLMPNVDGFEFMRRMKSEPGFDKIPICVVTAAANLVAQIPPEIKHLQKPFDVDSFLRIVKELTEMKNAA